MNPHPSLRSGLTIVILIAAGVLIRCGTGVEPEAYTYDLALSQSGNLTVGAVLLELDDPSGNLDSQQVTYIGSVDGYTVTRFQKNQDRKVWRFLVLKKRGSIEMDGLFALTTTRQLEGRPRIIEACDTLGVPLSIAGFRAWLLKTY